MRLVFPLFLLATPAVAHEGAHLHPHGVEGWVVGLGLLALVAGVAILALGRRK